MKADSTRSILGLCVSTFLVVMCLVPATALANTYTVQEETLYTFSALTGGAFSQAGAGDLVLCDVGPCDASHMSNWSDIAVSYDSSKGPYFCCTTLADSLYVYSGDETLPAYLANPSFTGLPGTVGVNTFFVLEVSGVAAFTTGSLTYDFISDEGTSTSAPEPATLSFLAAGLIGIVGMRRKMKPLSRL